MRKLLVWFIVFSLLPIQSVHAQAPRGFAVIESWDQHRVKVVWKNPGIDLESIQGYMQFYAPGDPQDQPPEQIPLMYNGYYNDEYIWYGIPTGSLDTNKTFQCGSYRVSQIVIGFYYLPVGKHVTIYCHDYFPTILK